MFTTHSTTQLQAINNVASRMNGHANGVRSLPMDVSSRRGGKLCFTGNAGAAGAEQVDHGDRHMTYSMYGMCLRIFVCLIAVLSVTGKWIRDVMNKAQVSLSGLPQLYCKNTPLVQYLLKHCQVLTQPFQPTFWARNGHIQTLLWMVLSHEDMKFSREYLEMVNKGIVALDWADFKPTDNKKNQPILVIVPEITFDCFDVAQLCWETSQRGFRPVVFNRRGHGGVSLVTAKLQSFGDTSDLREAIRYIHSTNKCSQICALGISSGCGLLISYLGEHGSSTDLSAAVCISPSYNYPDCIQKIRQPYKWCMLQKHKYFLTKHCDALAKSVDLDKAFATSSLHDWEANVYSSMCDTEEEDEYWEQNSPLREVDEIAVPLMCINATDDPISTVDDLPYDLFTTLPNVLLVTTKYGGHCGFYEGSRPSSWALRLTMDYIHSVLQYSAFIKVNNK